MCPKAPNSLFGNIRSVCLDDEILLFDVHVVLPLGFQIPEPPEAVYQSTLLTVEVFPVGRSVLGILLACEGLDGESAWIDLA